MQERGDLVKDEAGRWLAVPDLSWDSVPSRVADAIAARIERLDRPARDILRIAGVEGETFTAEVVARVLELDARHVAGALGAGLDRTHRLVDAVDVRRGPAGLVSRYRFRHNLIQHYVYDSIDEGERAYLHDAVGEALEALLGADADPVALALHYGQARAPERAAVHHRKAGDQARKAHALDQAIEHYQAALQDWPEREPGTRAALLRDLGDCQLLRRQLGDARRHLTEARDDFEAAGDVRAAGATQCLLGHVSTVEGDHAAGYAAYRHAVAMLEPLGESAELAAAMGTLGYHYALITDFEQAAAWGDRAMAMAESVGARDVLVQAMTCVGTSLPHLDPLRYEEGIELLERSFRLADELSMELWACLALGNLGDVLEGFGRYREAVARYRSGTEYARRHQVRLSELDGQERLWWQAWLHGDWAEAFELQGRVRSRGGGTRPSDFGAQAHAEIFLAWSELDLGRAEQARALLEPHVDALRHLPRPGERLPGLAVYLRASAGTGHREEAERDANAIADAVGSAPPIEFDTIVPVLEALRQLVLRPGEDAEVRIATCLNALERLARHFDSPEANAALREGQALRAGAAGSLPEAATLWAQAAEAWREGTFALREARARAAAAHALRRAGRDDEARGHHERAQTLLSTLEGQIPGREQRSSFASAARAMLASNGRQPD